MTEPTPTGEREALLNAEGWPVPAVVDVVMKRWSNDNDTIRRGDGDWSWKGLAETAVQALAQAGLLAHAFPHGPDIAGKIVTASFEDGAERGPDCGLEYCECPEHEGKPRPAGTYVTVRLDEDHPVGLWDVALRVKHVSKPARTTGADDQEGSED